MTPTPPVAAPTSSGPSPRLRRGLGALVLLATMAVPTLLAAQTANELQVTPETMTLAVGQKQPIFATAYDRQGNIIATAKFTFWSSDTSIVRVGRDGTVQGVAPGLAKVEARLQTKRASLAVLVTGGSGQGGAGPGSVLTLEPASMLLLPGESARIAAQALQEDGSAATAGRVTWKSLKPEVATVDSTGLVTAVAAGKSIVQATGASGLMATAPVDVEAADIALAGTGETLGPDELDTLHVRVPSQNNREVRGGLQWETADTSVLTVSPEGIVRARAPGRAEVIARAFGQERRATIVVHRLPQTLVVSPKPMVDALLVPLKATRQFSAVAEAADSTPIPEVHVVWEIGDTTIAGFDTATGILTARATGPTTVTARVRGFEPVVWKLQIVPGVLSVDRPRAGVRLGDRTTIAAVLLEDDGKLIGPATGVEWSSDHPEIASVTGGELRGVSLGRAQITATAPWGKAVTAEAFVTGDLIVASNRGGALGLYQVRADSPDSLLPLLVDGGGNTQGVLSPDRTRVAYSSMREGTYDLYVMDADGRNSRRLTVDAGSEGEPAWTPDGARIIYTLSSPGVVPQLVSVKVDGTDPRPLTSSAGGNRQADVSPDGRRIAFVSTRDGNPELYEMNADGSEPRRLTKTGDRENYPRYLPNGDLVYVVEKGNSGRVLRLPAGAAAALPVLQIDQPVVALDVSRDGERLAYVAGKLSEAGKGKSQLTLRIQSLGPDSSPVVIPLRPGEQVMSSSF